MYFPTEHPQFITITAYDWKPLLKLEEHKRIVVDSLDYLSAQGRIRVFAFVLMENHMHLIWQVKAGYSQQAVQRDFLKFVAQQIKFDLQKSDPGFLKEFEVNLKDRKYQFWQRNSLCVEIRTEKVFQQKLDYIHQNPVKAGLCRFPEDYPCSSASFYELNKSPFDFLCAD